MLFNVCQLAHSENRIRSARKLTYRDGKENTWKTIGQQSSNKHNIGTRKLKSVSKVRLKYIPKKPFMVMSAPELIKSIIIGRVLFENMLHYKSSCS